MFVTAEDVLPLVADIASNPQEYFVCPTMRLQPTQKTARLRRAVGLFEKGELLWQNISES